MRRVLRPPRSPVSGAAMKTLRGDVASGGFPVTPAQAAQDKFGRRTANATPASITNTNATPLNYTGRRSTTTNSTMASFRYGLLPQFTNRAIMKGALDCFRFCVISSSPFALLCT